MTTISELRKRVWHLANKSIDALNNLNEIIFKGASASVKPQKIDNESEDLKNINLQYIEDGINTFHKYISEVNLKSDYLSYLQNKHQECLDALKVILK